MCWHQLRPAPPPCDSQEVAPDFVTPWGTPTEIATTGAGHVEIVWNSSNNPIPTRWTMEIEPNVLEAWVCADYGNQIQHIKASGWWIGPDGLRLPAEVRNTWHPDGRLTHSSFIQMDESIPESWADAYDAFLIDVGYRNPNDPGELTRMGFGIANDGALLRPIYRTDGGAELNLNFDDGLDRINGVVTQRTWPRMNGTPYF